MQNPQELNPVQVPKDPADMGLIDMVGGTQTDPQRLQEVQDGELSGIHADSNYHRIQLTKEMDLYFNGNRAGTQRMRDSTALRPDQVASLLRFKPMDYSTIGGGKPIAERNIFEILAETSNLGTIRGIRAMEYPDALRSIAAIVQSYHAK